MSYILDALRKSAEERKKRQTREESPYEPLYVEARDHQKKRPSPLLILISLIIFAGVVTAGGWFFISLQKSPENSARLHTDAPRQDTAGNAKGKDTPAPQMGSTTGPDPAPAEAPYPPEVPVKEQALLGNQAQSFPPATGSQSPKPEPSPIPLLQDLPFAQQAAIPEMKYSGHVYSPDPELRLIMVNTAVVREGEMISPDIKLVEIVDNGLILQYRQTRFKVELF